VVRADGAVSPSARASDFNYATAVISVRRSASSGIGIRPSSVSVLEELVALKGSTERNKPRTRANSAREASSTWTCCTERLVASIKGSAIATASTVQPHVIDGVVNGTVNGAVSHAAGS